MAVNIVVGDILKIVVACFHTKANQIGESRLYYRVFQNSPPALSLEELGEAMAGFYTTAYRAWLSSSCKYNGISIQKVRPGTRSATFYALRDLAGTGSTAGTMASQVSGLVRFPTSEGDGVPPLPPTKGRAFVPFVSKSFFDGDQNSLSDGGKAALDTVAQKLGPRVSPGTGIILDLIVFSEANSAHRFAQQTTASWYTATQRRRSAFGQQNKAFGGG